MNPPQKRKTKKPKLESSVGDRAAGNSGTGMHNEIAAARKLKTLTELQQEILLSRLELFNFNRTHTALSLGVSVRCIRGHINAYAKTGAHLKFIRNPAPSKPIKLVCAFCGTTFDKSLSVYNHVRKKGQTRFFCKKSCVGAFLKEESLKHEWD